MAMAKKTASQKILAMIRNYGPKELAELDAEIERTESELKRLRQFRDVVGGPRASQYSNLAAALRGQKPAAAIDDDENDDEPKFATTVNEADKPALRRKIVAYLKEHGVKRNDMIAKELEVTKEIVLDLLAHIWFAKANNVGGFTLTAEGHVEANRLAGK